MIHFKQTTKHIDGGKTELGELSVDNVEAANFVLAERSPFFDIVAGNRLVVYGAAPIGEHKLAVRAVYTAKRDIVMPFVGVTGQLPTDDPTENGGALQESRILNDPTGQYALLGGLLIPKLVSITVESAFVVDGSIDVKLLCEAEEAPPPATNGRAKRFDGKHANG